MDCIVHGVANSWTQLSDFHFISLHLIWNSDLQYSRRHYVKLTRLQMRGLSQTCGIPGSCSSWRLYCPVHNLTWKRAPEDPGESVGRRGATAPCRHLPASRCTAPCSLRLFGFDSTVLEVAQFTHQAVSPLFYSAPIFKPQTIQEEDLHALNSATYKL